VTFEKSVISSLWHFEQKVLEAFTRSFREQCNAKNASVSLFHRGSVFSRLLLESLDYFIFKVPDQQLCHEGMLSVIAIPVKENEGKGAQDTELEELLPERRGGAGGHEGGWIYHRGAENTEFRKNPD